MKTCKTLALAIALAFSGPLLAGPGHDHKHDHDHTKDHQPQHGGVMVVGPGHQDWELVATPARITLHVRNEGRPLATAGASGKLTLLVGKEKSDVALKPAGASTLQAEGPFKLAPKAKLVATVQLAGKPPANLRFVLP